MKRYIIHFSEQLAEALEIGRNSSLSPPPCPIQQVVISGLGGSGIGGKIVAQLVEKQSKVPIQTNNNYHIPEYVNSNTLVIISSYSGNTEETINALNEALQKNAQIACITSGGQVHKIAQKHKLNTILIPEGYPPRAAFAYSFTQLFFILAHYSIISDNFQQQIHCSIQLLNNEDMLIRIHANEISDLLWNKLPIIYTDCSNEGVAVRFRQQLNENAKVLCWHHVFPEMNHNELVGWTSKEEQMAVVIFRNKSDDFRNQKRIEISKEIISKYTSTIIEIFSKGETAIENTLYLIHLGDWISYFLAEKKEIDSIEVKVIDYLKDKLKHH